MEQSSREAWADYAKVILIYMVTLVHVPVCEPLYTTIYTFLIPAFFFVSGYFFSYDRHPLYLPFLRRRLKSLMLPYVSLALLAYVFWLLVGRHYGDDAAAGVAWWRPLVAILFGEGKGMAQAVPLWFVMALFVCENLFWFIGRCIRHDGFVLLVVLFAAGWVNSSFGVKHLPFELNAALACMPFYLFGMMVRRRPGLLPSTWLSFGMGVAAVAVAAVANDTVYVHDDSYGIYPLFLLGALGGIYALVPLCRLLPKVAGFPRAVRFVAQSTLVVCGLHLVAYTLLKGVMVYVLGIDIAVLPGSSWQALLFGLAGLACCQPVYWLLSRRLPWLLGRW